MKITLDKLFLIILFILNVSCKSGNNITDISPPPNSECIADCADICGGSAVLSGCDNTCGSTLENDACDVCGGEITNESDCPDIPVDTVEVLYNTDTPIAGFQFHIDGVTVTAVSGGDADVAGFTTTAGNNTILGFSFSGATIPAGEGVLVVLEVTGTVENVCLSDLVISDSVGNPLEAMVEDCTTIKY